MALPIKLIAGIATTTAAAAAAAGAYIVINSQNAGPTTKSNETTESRPANSEPANGIPEEGPDELTLCVGDDRILRVPPGFGKECPSDQRELLLAWDSDPRLCELCDPLKDSPPSEPKSDNAAVNDLEDRIRDLERTSYFEVINQKEQPILQVKPGGVRIFNPQQRAVAFVGTPDEGGYFTARSPAGTDASLAASGDNSGVLIGDTGSNRIELGERSKGPYALRFPSGKGLIAGIGESRAGTGAMLVGTLPGVTQATFLVSDGRGMISLTKDGGKGGLVLTEVATGGGLLDIANAAGDSAVKMGNVGQRYGIVMAGPVPGLPYVPRSGLPGSYFMGCASGEKPACTPAVP
jgi:hypothetical protein